MTLESDVVQAIANKQGELTSGQTRIADFILRNRSKAAFLTARELADASQVSESSVIRFAYFLGFGGYPELQASLQEEINAQLTLRRYLDYAQDESNVVQTVIETNIANLETVRRSLSDSEIHLAAQHIAAARRCYVIGFRAGAGLAVIASSAISQLCHNCIQLTFEYGETLDKLVGAGPSDVLLALAFRRYSRRTLDIARYSKEQGVFVIGMTDSVLSPLCKYSDIVLVGEVESPAFSYSLVAPLSIIDCLVVALGDSLGTTSAENLKRWEETFGYFGQLETKQAL